MNQEENHIEEEKISLGLLIQWFFDWVKYLFSKWLLIGIGTVLILILIVAYNYLKPKVYFSKTTFVLENESTSSLGGISSLASVAGINLGSITDGNTLFQIDNIQALYRSFNMIQKTLLFSYDFQSGNEQLISRLSSVLELNDDLIKKDLDLDSFKLPREDFSRAQDSVLFELSLLVQEQFLHVAKPNRKTSILEIGFYSKDEELAKAFNEIHVRNVNQFYQQTKAKKASLSVEALTKQADSVRTALDESLLFLAQAEESVPNPNPLYRMSQVPYQKALIQVQANGAVYQEIVKQLEIAKISLRNNTPLIQVIDIPKYPLQHNQWKLFKTLVVGIVVGLALMLLYFTLKRMFSIALKN
ncbi:hypothetical protein [Roseivirga sp. 4D4]|uniref:hypothetical protein n=1 Tax=Roseivirga sp. 4D4 TaxID=1889784 RepID=UPI0009F1D5DC|nr:hypothetical protein [Roseivirga sp. 4D4]